MQFADVRFVDVAPEEHVDMSATEAMVVPSLNVLAWITEFPTLIGTSRIIPSIVDRICVLLSSL